MLPAPQLKSLLPDAGLLVLLAGFTLLSLGMVPLYFSARKPRRGTLEWMQRLETPSFGVLPRCRPGWADVAWALLCALCAAFLHFARDFFLLPEPSVGLASFLTHLQSTGRVLLYHTVAALALYALLRLMFGGIWPAVFLSALSGLLLPEPASAWALLACSLLFLYLWMTLPADAGLLPGGLWLLASMAAYALALFPCMQLLWLMPFYIVSYAVCAIARWRSAGDGKSGKHFALSLAAVSAAALAGSWMVWALYSYLQGWLGLYGLSYLLSGDFFRAFAAFIRSALSQLFAAPSWLWLGQMQTLTVLALLLCSLVPLLHGAFCLRDSRCLLLCGLLLCSLCALLVSGQGALALAVLAALGWLWNTLQKRQKGLWVGVYAALTAFFCVIEIIL